jgi:hypothetical protein
VGVCGWVCVQKNTKPKRIRLKGEWGRSSPFFIS